MRENDPMTPAEEARFLYSLLDAAESENRICDPILAKKWLALKSHGDLAYCETSHDSLIELLGDLNRTGALVGTWIEAHWLAAKTRNKGGKSIRSWPRQRREAERATD